MEVDAASEDDAFNEERIPAEIQSQAQTRELGVRPPPHSQQRQPNMS
jgi:hypothetical protein